MPVLKLSKGIFQIKIHTDLENFVFFLFTDRSLVVSKRYRGSKCAIFICPWEILKVFFDNKTFP